MARVNVEVLHGGFVDGVFIHPGDSISMDNDDAVRAVQDGWVRLAQKKSSAPIPSQATVATSALDRAPADKMLRARSVRRKTVKT